MQTTRHLRLVTALGRHLDAAVCAGSIANAARSVRDDEERAGQRRDALAAVSAGPQLMAATLPRQQSRIGRV
jgi:hypothetical protein